MRPLAGQIKQAVLEGLEVEAQPAIDALPALALVNGVVHFIVVLNLEKIKGHKKKEENRGADIFVRVAQP